MTGRRRPAFLIIIPLTLAILFAIFAWWAMRKPSRVDRPLGVCDPTEPQLCLSTIPPMQAQGRVAFDSAVSPDGNWLEAVTSTQSSDGVWTHRILLQQGLGKPDREVVRVEQRRGYDEWQAAGWSADGQKIYYATMTIPQGMGGRFPDFSTAYSELYEVDVSGPQPSPPRLVFSPLGEKYVTQGVHDAYAAKNLVTYSEVTGFAYAAQYSDTLYLGDLHGKLRKQILWIDRARSPNDGISYAVINPAGAKIYIVEYALLQNQDRYQYTSYVYDIAVDKLTKMETADEAHYLAFKKWQDDQHILLGDATIIKAP